MTRRPTAASLRDAASRWRWVRPNLDTLRPLWAAHAADAKRQITDLCVSSDAEDVHLGPLSPGCQACRDGTWDCLFLVGACNLACAFCCSPRAVPHHAPRSAFGATREAIAAGHARTRITGVSFSGGEPFLDVSTLCEWLAWFKARRPDQYFWVYTNGLLATEERVARLAALGLDEIRFNLAATGYQSPVVMPHVSAAARHVRRVSVEIPAIPADAELLLGSLAEWSARGVRYLNLHELMHEPGTPSAELAGPRLAVVTADGHCTAVDPRSRALTLAVMRAVQDRRLPLAVNDCSLLGKVRQLRGRRRSLAPLLQQRHERLVDDEVYESGCAYRGDRECRFFHPDAWPAARARYPRHSFARAARLAPLSVDEPWRWIRFDRLDAAP